MVRHQRCMPVKASETIASTACVNRDSMSAKARAEDLIGERWSSWRDRVTLSPDGGFTEDVKRACVRGGSRQSILKRVER